ncbi:hypothetical protein HF909_10435 [Ralstonia pseudosolanacearum]|uniref:Uncharacterized protein n=1 Tax=Ralstonia solanacearum TaxID=305 RepID=A0AA92QBC6_RALSL|nr:hypothetical protein [Ralstonia pseudosolanacearum]QOK96808.1 hypothetical protein HF909_10435 [Ralstonia pseudosolanacearum]
MDKQTYRVGATPIHINGKRAEPDAIVELTDEEAADLGDHVSPAAAEAAVPKTAKKGGNA